MSRADFIEKLQEEETNLELHTKLCAQRYEQITNKFDRIDERLDRIESTLIEIKETITSRQENTYKTYLGWAGFIIITLMGVVGFLFKG